MNNQENIETKILCRKWLELDELIKNISMANAHDVFVKYEHCWDCQGYNDKCREYLKK